MGSMAMGDVTAAEAVVPKTEPHDEYTPSSASSPEPELGAPADGGSNSQEPAPVPKRKGGRKPIYATSEERKQRNRQAQAAFRERRTEYIKQLETTIQQHEESLQNLQQSHRTAADECLMLRYKNSLLERILLEKGIDVQAELRLKGSPHLRPIRHGASITGQASPMQKAMLNRQQQVRQRPSHAPPIQTVNADPQPNVMSDFSGSSMVQPTPPSQHSSPSTARSPGFALQGPMASPTNEIPAPHQQSFHQPQRHMQHPQQNPYATQTRPQSRPISASGPPSQFPPPSRSHTNAQQGYYQSSFKNHYDQLDQEYDTQADMLDEIEGEDVDADSFIPSFRLPPTGGNPQYGMQVSPPVSTSAGGDSTGGAVSSLPFDYDPMLDADPFGLTASMTFPNNFSFPQPRR